MFYIFKNFVFSFLATVGFSMLLNVPKKSIHLCSLSGAVGWTLYIILRKYGIDNVNSNLYSSIIIALMGEIFARLDKEPVTIFVIPGIFCIVPGYGIYNAMKNLMEKNYEQASRIGFETVFVAGAIATGIIIVSSIFKIYSKYKSKAKI
ncbi:threonine/serine exporter family protein [Peptoanaerobacter stomatis]|uniref:threonine/serine exporter family protein n=1 Tax=Peptoanaerobacter stomatis TaxID=796937 RepID=UPI003F9F2281